MEKNLKKGLSQAIPNIETGDDGTIRQPLKSLIIKRFYFTTFRMIVSIGNFMLKFVKFYAALFGPSA